MTQTPLPTRFSRNPNREQWVRKLVDGHKIGLAIDDPDTRDDPCLKIRNYGMIAPYGGAGTSIFVHGKSLFLTKEAADAFYASHQPDVTLCNPDIIHKVAHIYLPESFDARIANYMVKDATEASRLAFKVVMLQKLYPKIGFSVLPSVNEENMEHVEQGLEYILGGHHISKAKAMQQLEHYMTMYDRCNYADVIKGYMQDEVQRDYLVYMAEDTFHHDEAQAKQQWGQVLQDYLKDHDWDWEILENFKVAARASSSAKTLDVFLRTGAELRAYRDVEQLAISLHNPYDPLFDEVERTMAEVTADAVQPVVIDYLARTHSALLFTDATDIDMFKQASMFADIDTEHAKGIHLSSADRLSTSVVGFSEIHKSHHDLVGTICHEIEHKLDLDSKKNFAEKYKARLPAMIREDIEHFAAVETFIRGVDSSTPEAAHDLRVLGKKRGLRVDIEDVETLKQGLLLDMEDIKERLGVFANKYKKYNQFPYDKALRNLEIPAIMEELKGAYGRKFIEAILPQLSLTTESHRKTQLYGKQISSSDYAR